MGLFYKDTNGNIHTIEGSQTQFSVLPTPSADLVGEIYQYTGNTTTTYTNGWFYKCVQGETVGTYEWTPIAVQSGGGGTQMQSDWGQTDTEAVDFIKNKPTLGTASTKDVAISSDASATQVVMGDDSRLNNSISSTSTASPLTDSADGMVQGLTIYGRSEVVEGEIRSVGDNGLTVTTANSDNTLTTSAEFTTALPLRGVSDTVRDKLTCTADKKQVETVCGTITPNTIYFMQNLSNQNRSVFAILGADIITYSDSTTLPNLLAPNFTTVSQISTWQPNNISQIITDDTIYITVSPEITTVEALQSAYPNLTILYELAEPVTTPLTSTEISAFRGLRTFDSTTNITITDDPEFEIDYLKNTENGQAVANIQKDLQEQIDESGGSADFPVGGTTGQVLAKASDADNDVEWGSISSVRIDDTTPSASTVFSSRKTDTLIKTPMTGASQYADGTVGAVPQPISGDDQKALFGDGTYHTIYTSASGSTVIVKTTETSLYGRTVTLSMGTQSLTATIGTTGEATFTNVSFYGTVNVVADDGNGNYARGSANLTYFGTYVVSLTMNFATLNFMSDNAALVGKNLDLKIGNKTITTFQLSLVAGTTDTYMGTVYVDRLATYKVDTMTDVGRVRGTVVADTYTTYNATVSTGEIYAFKINHNDSNPATCVTPYENEYGCDNLNFTPAHMDFTNDTFDYGSWTGQEFFFPKPCMLKYDGTVDYYLDPNDYSLRTDGTPSDVANMSYAGNVMVEFPTIYFKRWQEGDYSYCIISDKQLGADFHAYAHHDVNGNVLPYIYIAAYNGSYDGTRLRSISGIAYHNANTLTANKILSNTTAQQDITFAQANNTSGETGEGWYLLHKADRDMINDLLLLISMNTDTQTIFGQGKVSGYTSETNTGIISTGTMNNKGMFWGKSTDDFGVKIFHIENWWGNFWKRCFGWINNNGVQKVKMTYGQEDGSITNGFNVDGTGYITISNSTPDGTTNSYISSYYTSEYGFVPKTASGTSTTYLCDAFRFKNTVVAFSAVGGDLRYGNRAGAFHSVLYDVDSLVFWGIGESLTYKGITS